MIGAFTQTEPHSKVKFPFGPEVQIHDREDHMLLLIVRIETAELAERGIILEAAGDARGDFILVCVSTMVLPAGTVSDS